MSGFKFRQQRLLEYLIRIEVEKKNDLAKVMGKVNREQAFIERAKARRQALLAAPGIEGVPDDQTGLRCMLFGSFEKSASIARKMINSMQDELAQVRQAYLAARQKRQALEKLKEKKKQEWEFELARQERRITDERAGQQYILRGRE